MAETNHPRLAENSICTGCGACANGCARHAIHLLPDREGFLYPVVSDACIECGHCEHICPAGKHRDSRPTPTAFAVWDKSSPHCNPGSATLLSLANNIIEMGGVVFGACFDENMRPEHRVIDSKKDLHRLIGMTPVQSSINDCYYQAKHSLNSGRYVLFFGTPCQIDGLYRYLGDRPEKLITVDFMCSGEISPGVWEKIVHSMTYIKKSNLKHIDFALPQEKQKGLFFYASFANGSSFYAPFSKTELGRGFVRRLMFRPACYQCMYASTNRVGDLTIGCLEENSTIENPPEQLVSLLLINSEKGAHIFDGLTLSRRKVSLDQAVACNKAISIPPEMPADRRAFFDAYAKQPFSKVSAQFLSLIQKRESPTLMQRIFRRKVKGDKRG